MYAAEFAVISYSVIREGWGDYVLYHVKVTPFEPTAESWVVFRRFNDFKAFQVKLCQECPEVLGGTLTRFPLPSDGFATFLPWLRDGMLQQRSAALAIWLSAVFSDARFQACPSLAAFVSDSANAPPPRTITSFLCPTTPASSLSSADHDSSAPPNAAAVTLPPAAKAATIATNNIATENSSSSLSSSPSFLPSSFVRWNLEDETEPVAVSVGRAAALSFRDILFSEAAPDAVLKSEAVITTVVTTANEAIEIEEQEKEASISSCEEEPFLSMVAMAGQKSSIKSKTSFLNNSSGTKKSSSEKSKNGGDGEHTLKQHFKSENMLALEAAVVRAEMSRAAVREAEALLANLHRQGVAKVASGNGAAGVLSPAADIDGGGGEGAREAVDTGASAPAAAAAAAGCGGGACDGASATDYVLISGIGVKFNVKGKEQARAEDVTIEAVEIEPSAIVEVDDKETAKVAAEAAKTKETEVAAVVESEEKEKAGAEAVVTGVDETESPAVAEAEEDKKAEGGYETTEAGETESPPVAETNRQRRRPTVVLDGSGVGGTRAPAMKVAEERWRSKVNGLRDQTQPFFLQESEEGEARDKEGGMGAERSSSCSSLKGQQQQQQGEGGAARARWEENRRKVEEAAEQAERIRMTKEVRQKQLQGREEARTEVQGWWKAEPAVVTAGDNADDQPQAYAEGNTIAAITAAVPPPSGSSAAAAAAGGGIEVKAKLRKENGEDKQQARGDVSEKGSGSSEPNEGEALDKVAVEAKMKKDEGGKREEGELAQQAAAGRKDEYGMEAIMVEKRAAQNHRLGAITLSTSSLLSLTMMETSLEESDVISIPSVCPPLPASPADTPDTNSSEPALPPQAEMITITEDLNELPPASSGGSSYSSNDSIKNAKNSADGGGEGNDSQINHVDTWNCDICGYTNKEDAFPVACEICTCSRPTAAAAAAEHDGIAAVEKAAAEEATAEAVKGEAVAKGADAATAISPLSVVGTIPMIKAETDISPSSDVNSLEYRGATDLSSLIACLGAPAVDMAVAVEPTVVVAETLNTGTINTNTDDAEKPLTLTAEEKALREQARKEASIQRKSARAQALYSKEQNTAKIKAKARSDSTLSKLAASNPALAAKLKSTPTSAGATTVVVAASIPLKTSSSSSNSRSDPEKRTKSTTPPPSDDLNETPAAAAAAAAAVPAVTSDAVKRPTIDLLSHSEEELTDSTEPAGVSSSANTNSSGGEASYDSGGTGIEELEDESTQQAPERNKKPRLSFKSAMKFVKGTSASRRK